MTKINAILVLSLFSSSAFSEPVIHGPEFNEQGDVVRPLDWERWIYVGSPLTPNALNNGNATFKEFHNVYIEPSAFDHYKTTGTFANGTQLVKARTALYVGDSCRSVSKENGSCQAVSGRGYFEGEYTGFELTVKDTERFPEEPGGWVYYAFGESRPWKDTAKPFPSASCNSCHSFQADDDFVFTQFYPVLRDNDPKTKK